MKKRTAFIGAILSLIPLGQPLIIKTGLVLSSSAVMLSLPEKVHAESAFSFTQSGINHYKKGDYFKAVYDLTKAIEIDPNYADAYHWRALVKMLLEDYSSALRDINKTLQLLPNDKAALTTLGLVKMSLKDMKGACDAWRKSADLGWENAKKWIREDC
mgnify:CR=1 FL=1